MLLKVEVFKKETRGWGYLDVEMLLPALNIYDEIRIKNFADLTDEVKEKILENILIKNVNVSIIYFVDSGDLNIKSY